MTQQPPKYDLEQRMLVFARNVRDFVQSLPVTPANKIYTDQVLRSSSSIGANYIEGNDALGKKDFLVKMRTSRREARETRFWLQLFETGNRPQLIERQKILIDEVGQLIKILSAIIQKVQL